MLLFVLFSFQLLPTVVGQKQGAYALETARPDLERQQFSSNKKRNATVVDLARFFTRREKKTLEKQVGKSLSKDMDVAIVVASNVESGYSPKEMATTLLNTWDMGSESHHLGGVLILLSMEDSRIELELSDSLIHIFDSDWCNELLYTRVIPYFRDERYSDGLLLLVEELKRRLEAHRFHRRANTKKRASKQKKGRRRRQLLGLSALGAGGYATRDEWLPLFENDDQDDFDHHHHYDDGYDAHHKHQAKRRYRHYKPSRYDSNSFSDFIFSFPALLNRSSRHTMHGGSTKAHVAPQARTRIRTPGSKADTIKPEDERLSSASILNTAVGGQQATGGAGTSLFGTKTSVGDTAVHAVKAAALRQPPSQRNSPTKSPTGQNKSKKNTRASGMSGAGASWGAISSKEARSNSHSTTALSGAGGSWGSSSSSKRSQSSKKADRKGRSNASSGNHGAGGTW